MSQPDKVDRPNTLVVTIPNEFCLYNAEIVDKLIVGHDISEISCIQFVRGRRACITFSSFDAGNSALLSGIFLESTRLYTREADPVMSDVYLHYLPVESSDDVIHQALFSFGTVHSIVDLNHPGTSIGFGIRLLKMSLTSDIPINLCILHNPCRIYYTGQPHSCSICRSPDQCL